MRACDHACGAQMGYGKNLTFRKLMADHAAKLVAGGPGGVRPTSPTKRVLLGNYVQSNVRELEGLLRHLIARASMYGRDITVDDAKDALQLRGLAHRGAGQNILDVQSVVADKLGVSVDELKGKSRKREVARARQIAMFLSREVTGDSLAVVGAHFGKRDHSTVVHAIQTIQTLASTDPNIEKLLKELRTEFER